jgi:hypothetical protein
MCKNAERTPHSIRRRARASPWKSKGDIFIDASDRGEPAGRPDT